MLSLEAMAAALKDWFSFVSLPEKTDALLVERPCQQTTQNLILLSTHIMGLLQSRGTSVRDTEQTILIGTLKCCHPSRLGFSVGHTALAALAKWTSLLPEWKEDLLSIYHRELDAARLITAAVHHIRRLFVESDDPELDREIRLWSKSLLLLCRCLAKHPQLRSALIGGDVMRNLWLHCCAMFHPQGADLRCRGEEDTSFYIALDIEEVNGTSTVVEYRDDVHLRKAYMEDGRPNLAFEQWCHLLRLVGDIVQHPRAQGLFDKVASLAFVSMPQYLACPFGTYREPLTLARVHLMQANLEFLVTSHEAFAMSVASVSHYQERRNDVLAFLRYCDAVVERCDGTFVCPPVSPEETALASTEVKFDYDLGWFQICKVGSHRLFFPDQHSDPFGERSSNRAVSAVHRRSTLPKFPLTHYAWKCAKGIYSCIALALEYTRKSMPVNKERMDEPWWSMKDVIENIQNDVMSLGSWLTNVNAADEASDMLIDIQELVHTLLHIFGRTEEFLADWGFSRKRRQQDQLNTQLDTLQQLLIER